MINFRVHKYLALPCKFAKKTTIQNINLLKKMLPQKPFRNLPQASATHELLDVLNS